MNQISNHIEAITDICEQGMNLLASAGSSQPKYPNDENRAPQDACVMAGPCRRRLGGRRSLLAIASW